MKETFRHFLTLFKRNGLTLLMFEISYRAACYMLSLQVVRQAVELSLQVGGYSNLTAENFLLFLKEPITLFLLVLIGILLLFLSTVELASLMVCYQYSSENKKIYVSDMLLVGVRQTLRLMLRRPVIWALSMGLMLPFLQLQFLAWEVSYIKILQYALQVLYKLAPHGVLLGILGVLLLYFSYLCAFSLPYLLLSEKNIRESLRLGNLLRKQHPLRNLGGAVGVQLLVAGFSFVLYVCLMMGAVLFAMQDETKGGIVSSLLIYSSWVDMAIGLAAGALIAVFGTAFFYGVYRFGQEQDLEYRPEAVRGKIRLPGLRRLGRRRAAALGMGLVLLAELGYIYYLAGNSRSISQEVLTGTLITAHRGGAKYAPENTLSALNYAIEQNSDFAEIDVQETKDGVLVLLHDDNLKRTTGKNKEIWNTYYYEVQKLEAGSFFKKEFAGEKVPTLREAIRHCGTSMHLIIEIKDNGHNADIVPKVVKAVEDFNIAEQVIICSMNYGFLCQVKELNDHITTSYVMSVAYGNMEELKEADCLSVKHTYLTPLFVRKAHEAGKNVHAWTINTQWMTERMQYCQVDNIITDTPAAARQVLSGEWAKSVDFWELLKYVL